MALINWFQSFLLEIDLKFKIIIKNFDDIFKFWLKSWIIKYNFLKQNLKLKFNTVKNQKFIKLLKKL